MATGNGKWVGAKNLAGKKLGRGSGGATGNGFKPGCSGNLLGRPRRKPITDEILAKWDQPCELDRQLKEWDSKLHGQWKPHTWGERYVLSLYQNAFAGNQAAIHEIYNRLEGRAPLVISGPDDEPAKHRFDFSRIPTKKLLLLKKILDEAMVVEPNESDASVLKR